MDDVFEEEGSMHRSRKSVRQMPKEPAATYFSQEAAKARELAERATAPGARNIHLEMAAGYDARAAKAAAQQVGKADSPKELTTWTSRS